MRLIDADKVKISYDKQVSGTIAEPVYNINVEAPTVEAIPIEWIKEWVKNDINGWHSVPTMLEDWEKENGKVD